MQKETITPLKRITLPTLKKKPADPCCGGAPAQNADACCKLDEEKKAGGEEGCGCNSKGNMAAAVCC